MQAQLKHCSTKAVLYISNVSAPFLPSFTHNLMHTRCSCSSDIPHDMNYNKALLHDSLQPMLTKDWDACWDHPLSQGEGVLGNLPANRGVPKCTHSWVKKLILECFDHILYVSMTISCRWSDWTQPANNTWYHSTVTTTVSANNLYCGICILAVCCVVFCCDLMVKMEVVCCFESLVPTHEIKHNNM